MGNSLAKIAPHSQLSQQFPPSSVFDPVRDLPDLTGKVIIVTGGNAGIGYHTVRYLLLKNAKVYLAARSPSRCKDAVDRLKANTDGKEPILLQLDLGDLHSVRKAAEEFLSKEERLDVLFNNAGVMVPPTNQLTTQGYDLQFGTNVLGHYFFTKLLLPALERSTTHNGAKARVIITSSPGHMFSPGPTGIAWETVKGGPERDETIYRWVSVVRPWYLYGASKMGNVMHSNLLARYHGDIIAPCSLNPGGLKTDLQQHIPGPMRWLLQQFLYPAHYGAYTQLWAGIMPEAEGISGKYLYPWARIGLADPRAANEEEQDKLLEWLQKQVEGY